MPTFDELWPSGPRFRQDDQSFKLSTDSVLLSDFVNMKRVRRCLDLGSGAGVLCVLLAVKNPDAQLCGIEIQPAFAMLCRENLFENSLDRRVSIINADLRSHRTLVPAESYDLVVSNPPYFPCGSGYSAPDSTRATAREEGFCSLDELLSAARWSLRYGGSFCLVHRPERLSEIFCAMTRAGIEPKRLRPVSYSAQKAPSLVLIEGRRGGRPGLKIESPLVLTDASGKESDEVQRIYRRGKHLPLLNFAQQNNNTTGDSR